MRHYFSHHDSFPLDSSYIDADEHAFICNYMHAYATMGYGKVYYD